MLQSLKIFVSLHWTHYSKFTSVLYCGDPSWSQHSSYGLTSAEYRGVPQPAGQAFPNATQHTVCFLCFEGALLAHGQLVDQQDSKVVPFTVAFQPVSPQCVEVPGLIPPQMQYFAFSLC